MSQSFCNRQDYAPWVVWFCFGEGWLVVFFLPGKPFHSATRKDTFSQIQPTLPPFLCPLLDAMDITGYNKLYSNHASFNLHGHLCLSTNYKTDQWLCKTGSNIAKLVVHSHLSANELWERITFKSPKAMTYLSILGLQISQKCGILQC